jgi:hypothetical protein
LGLWVYFITFCALVWQLIQLGIIVGRDVVIDSTTSYVFSTPSQWWTSIPDDGERKRSLLYPSSLGGGKHGESEATLNAFSLSSSATMA